MLISDTQHVKLRHMHHIPLTTEQNLNKKLTLCEKKVLHADFDIKWLSPRSR